MGGINWKRVFVGGLLAGVVINLSEFILNGVVLMEAMEASMAGMNLEFAAWAMPFYVVMAFIWGFALVTLYAAVRPRFGPGPGSAISVGIGFWVIAVLMPTLSYAAMGMGGGMLGIGLIWTFVEMVVAASVGGWAYQEESVPLAAPAA